MFLFGTRGYMATTTCAGCPMVAMRAASSTLTPDWFKSKDVYRNVLQAPRNRIILFGLTACI